ncbi:hypothetical protein KPH14_003472 [Odynerus spinipes]|uniref:Major facilitator superfamily (MFS) profile domain-containing protein n=1 Tax=Odynerus spinipes TaxID=1348599 RepID=A0AAD9VKS7_9HYME|nr:hypothetical protein KPH14_003472 [Odynerus spinipes]
MRDKKEEQEEEASKPSVSATPTEESNCEYYDWNYRELRELGYREALKKVQSEEKPKTLPCKSFSYLLHSQNSTFVPEWNMVCDRLVMKATVQTAVSFGKFGGAFTFGIIADKYGRKTTFIIASMIYMISGPIIAWTRIYTIMLACRVGLGVAAIGVYQAAYSLLVEMCPPHLRSTLGVMFNQSYALGMVIISVIAYFVRPWRKLQLIICAPTYLLIYHMLVMPESPRWAYYSGRPLYAWSIVKSVMPPEKKKLLAEGRVSNIAPIKEKESFAAKFARFSEKTKAQLKYMKYGEVRTRLFLCWAIWCFTSMSYYALSITSGHLKIDSYLYTGLSGLVEGISYIIVVPLLKFLGRRGTGTFLLAGAGVAFVTLLFLPDDMRNTKMLFALLGRLCISSVFVAVIIHASELFPTVMRNTAIGTSSAWSHVGSTIAPYLVDYFVIYGWWVPNVMCGGTAFFSALLCQFLPETKDLVLYNTMEEFIEKCDSNPEERISLYHCFLLRMFKKRNPPATPQTS